MAISGMSRQWLIATLFKLAGQIIGIVWIAEKQNPRVRMHRHFLPWTGTIAGYG